LNYIFSKLTIVVCYTTNYMELGVRLRQFLWLFITPAFPYFRNALTFFGIVRHEGRQDFLLGHLPGNRTVEELKKYLKRYGFGNHFVAWIDDDEVLGLRLRENFTFQYHLRVFKDGEIRGHYELTPESHPVGHFAERVFEPRTEEFLRLLKDWVTPAREENSKKSNF
jgi:hypothetical protein